jgi:alcohol dehydrogenase class IV
MASDHETIFTMEATPVKFGTGASADAGWELRRLGVKRAMLVTDPGVAALGHPQRIKGLIEAEGIEVVVYDRARVEPTVDSFQPDILRELMQDIAAPRGVAELGYTEDDIPAPAVTGATSPMCTGPRWRPSRPACRR